MSQLGYVVCASIVFGSFFFYGLQHLYFQMITMSLHLDATCVEIYLAMHFALIAQNSSVKSAVNTTLN
jgi:hypothetical protein